MSRHHDRNGFKGARHLAHRDGPVASVISSAIGSLSNVLSPSESDDPLSGLPTSPVSLPSDIPSLPPVSISISDIPLPPLGSPPPPDTNSPNSTDSTSTSDTSSTTSVSSSRPANPTSDNSNFIQSTPHPLPSSTPHASPTAPSSSSHFNPSASFVNTGSSTITEVFTTTSGTLTLAITTTIAPSLSSNPGSDPSFFKDKGQAAAVLTVVILIGLLGFGFLGYRFVKTVKDRQLERELQDASRLNRSRAILDDGDDDAFSADSMRQAESSIWSVSQPGPSKQSSDMPASSAASKDSGLGYSAFESTPPSHTSRGHFSSEDNVSPINMDEIRFKTPSDVSFDSATGSNFQNLGSTGRNAFLIRKEDFRLPTSLLPDSFGEDTTQLLNAVRFGTVSADDQNHHHLRQQHGLRIANE